MSDLMLSTSPAPVFNPLQGDTLIRLSEVETVSGLKRSHIYKLIGENEFPRPTKIGAASRWSLREVHEWIADKLAEETRGAAQRINTAAHEGFRTRPRVK